MARVIVLLYVILFSVYITEQADFLQEKYINKINDEVTTWTAGVNFDPNTPKDHIIRLLGSKGLQHVKQNAHTIKYKNHDMAYNRLRGNIPKTFDARKEWRQCKTIGEVRNQGNCGSCWAVATSSAFSDRMCIATDGKFNQLLSIEELSFCCHLCGFGCQGGFPIMAWHYFRKHGIVTGGEYSSNEGCEPYKVAPCVFDEHGKNTCAGKPVEKNHKCSKTCYGEQSIDYKEDHKFTRDYYYLTNGTIQKDVLIYGPIEATFNVYNDFPNYKSGVYVKSENATLLGGHAVKLIGWGEEFGVPYWLMVNSWGDFWGDDGLFKIRRGTNECEVESANTGGVPVI